MNWYCIQPLTGGMYLGFEEVLGCPAKAIISYKGLNSYTPKKSNNQSNDPRGTCTNEYNLMQYLKKVNREVPRYEFVNGDELTATLTDKVTGKIYLQTEDGSRKFTFDELDKSEVDVVCAVPICSGLSTLSTYNKDERESRNCNMMEITKFVLNDIRPKVYIFENAPSFWSDRGFSLRKQFEQLAKNEFYSISYFKTDTKFHHNCQRRPRTFVMFVRCDYVNKGAPKFDGFEHVTLTPKEVFSSISENAKYNCSFPKVLFENHVSMQYAICKFPDTWRDLFKQDFILELHKRDLINDFIDYCNRAGDPLSLKMVDYVNKVISCMNLGKGWWCRTPKAYDDLMPAVQSKTLFSTIHPYEDRLLSEREHMKMMGLPDDFDMQGNFNTCCRQISQNVPVKTAAWIAREAKRIVDNWDEIENERDYDFGPKYFDNTQKLND